MDKDIVGSHVYGIEKLRKALEGDKLVCLVGRGASSFALKYTGIYTWQVEHRLAHAHPSDIKAEVQRLSERGTVKLVTTRNPLVLNELEPEQVFLLTHWGWRVTPITETINFAARAKVYALGELWLSYLHKTEDDSEPMLISAEAKP